ncbi:MAG: PhoPQ-activated protein PqaA family protein, partial [Maioricimonas sp. JB049]
PNQPLLGNRVEDDLITETWLKYLETGDENWPLLFPMAKSAIKAMDALEEFAEQKLDQKLKGFVITGGSKRGWTSWLAPVVDDRIIATAPFVIDVLNFRPQMQHQLDSWGEFSEQIHSYTRKGLVKLPDEEETPREVRLREMMDPFSYREQVKIPKLLIVGTNDRFWVVDSMNIYFDDLVGPRFVRQVPNAGHSLQGGREAAMASLGVFFRHVVSGEQMPDVTWQFSDSDEQFSLRIQTDTAPMQVRLWSATSGDKDFRDATWTSSPMTGSDGDHVATIERPDGGHVAVFGEVQFEYEGIPWSLTTLVYRR